MRRQSNVHVTALHDVLHEQGRSKVWLAYQLRVHRTHLHDMVTGRENPWPDLAERIAAVLNVPVERIALDGHAQ